ncbi:RNA polymerase sigma factor [Cryomorpha ignava]|uniref:RNA polymerase sigma factor n=1 Tax=Cryomorpha ignava TaxID=101383 RepID=A0A7K3WY06_9FLAO|nr:RNA polymerase sigma factor [Cryomorpha ignava]NEN25752.1 RNA polymerase sigma factor [Cryomorpha ignava]
MHQEEFTRTILVHKNKMYRFALSIMGNEHEAKDVVQDVMLKLWETRMELEDKLNLEAWCITLTRNKSLDKIKRMGRKLKSNLDDVGMKLVSDNPLPDTYTIQNDTMNNVSEALLKLPEQQKAVFQLRDVEGYSYLEICEALNMEMSKVKVYIFRARKSIKESLEKINSYGQ